MFEEGDNGAHDLCGAIRWKIEGGTVIDNRVHPWNPLLGKTSYTTQEEHYLPVGIRLAKNPPEVDGDWKGNQLMASTITESWSGARELFCELWTKDTLMTDADSWNDKEDLGSQTLLTPTKKFSFKEVESIFKSPNKHTRTNDSESSTAYFKLRSNDKPTKKGEIFRNMAFKTSLQLSLSISIQQVN